ncbi:MAG TPA: hypothetical protein VMV04_15685 [Thermodesulfobacteriota bacterium]|nr:hypothetical protein [Thermodesulfobacteriota bacterium]
MADPDPDYLNVGLMKPRRGLTPVAGKKKLGVGKRRIPLDIYFSICYGALTM